MQNKTVNTLLVILLLVLFGYFIYLGYAVIQSATRVYDKTVEIATAGKAPEKLCTTCIKDGYAQALLYFSIALGTIFLLFLLPRLQSIGFGGFSISLRELQSDVEKLKYQANNIQETIVDTGGGRDIPDEAFQEIKQKVSVSKREGLQNVKHPEDPQKGRWGSFPEKSGRKLSATVLPAGVPGFYKVRLSVESTQANNPLKGFVTFHLHPTFKNPNPVIAVEKGIAELQLNWVYGSFTVGAETDDGKTQLELDLAELPGVSEEFKKR